MKILKTLRDIRNLSQANLAKATGLSVSQIQLWESGKQSPSSKELQDLAFYFGCNVQDLINSEKSSEIKIPINTYYLLTDREREDGFWGHIGITLSNDIQTKWYPITIGEYRRAWAALQNQESSNEWLVVDTLNNRILLLNSEKINRIWLLDDAQDGPDEWAIPEDGYTGNPSEFYNAIDQFHSEDNELDLSEPLQKACENFTDLLDIDMETAVEFIYYTHIHTSDGEKISYWVNDEQLADLIITLDNTRPPPLINLSCDHFDCFYPRRLITLIDMPQAYVKSYIEKTYYE